MMSVWTRLRAWPRFRLMLLAVFLLSSLGTAASLFSQYVLDMDPCVMCIQQRLGLLFTAIAALPFLLLPQRWLKLPAALAVAAPTAFGLYIAIEQIRLQAMPPELQPSCGAPWTFRLRNWPLLDWYEPLIRGTGVCGEVYRLFGVSLPVWSMLFFSLILLLLAVGLYPAKRA